MTMAADNNECVFFWWTTSTVRHLGIGGKTSNKTIEPAGGLPPYDPEQRFAAYQAQMRTYNWLKPFFVHGQFHGIAEHVHLHTLPGIGGSVINGFHRHCGLAGGSWLPDLRKLAANRRRLE